MGSSPGHFWVDDLTRLPERRTPVGHHVSVQRRAILILSAALVVAATGCGSDNSGGTTASSPTTLEARADTFCDAWNAAMTSGDDSTFNDVLADAPAELEAAAVLVREAYANGSESPEAEAAAAEILNWTELHCQPEEPGQSRRHVAPPLDAELEGLTFCGTSAFPTSPDDGRSGMVLYGAADAEDPYDGPMIGVLWSPADGGGHGGDGDSEPVTVRGHSGVAAPITVFQQTIVPELGTVIAWTEGDRAFGLYGRGWSIERADELVAIADRLEEADEGLRIPGDALPEGYAEVFEGDPSVTSLLLAPSPVYSLQYKGIDGLLDLNGLQMSEAEFEAFRFFTTGVDQGDVGGHDGLVGNAWHAEGPAIVTWRGPDGLVVRIVGIGVPIEAARHVATEARELTDEEWAALVEADDLCQQP
jgi:hypothetical protein